MFFLNGKVKVFGWAVAAILLLVFLSEVFHFQFIENILMKVAAPFNKVLFHTSNTLSGTIKFISDIRNLSVENTDLKKENREFLAKLVDYNETKEENELLRNQLGFQKQHNFQFLEADIVSFDPNSFSHYAIINRGKNDGLSIGMPVIMPGNIIFGKISEVHPSYSKALIISDQNNKINVKKELSDISGVLGGSLGGNLLLMDLIERNASLEKGDLILTSGLDGVYPKNLIVGRVKEVIQPKEGIFKQAYIDPIYSKSRNTKVLIILP